MPATISQRDYRRAARWLDRTGGMAYVSPEAFALLAQRLAARRRNALWCLPLFPGAIISLSPLVLGSAGSQSQSAWGAAFAHHAFVALALVAVGALLAGVLDDRSERIIGRSLPTRYTRGVAVSVRTMLGRDRSIAVGVGLVLATSYVTLLVGLHPSTFDETYAAATAVLWALMAARIRQVATRSTVAYDAVSLAIDERLRSEDAYSATVFIYVVMFIVPASSMPGPSYLLGQPVAVLAIAAVWVFGYFRRPWQRLPASPLPTSLQRWTAQ